MSGFRAGEGAGGGRLFDSGYSPGGGFRAFPLPVRMGKVAPPA